MDITVVGDQVICKNEIRVGTLIGGGKGDHH